MGFKSKFVVNKELTRKAEAVLEVLILSVTFFLLWRDEYRTELLPYYKRGKFVFTGVYFVIVYFSLNSLDSFLFGRLKATDIIFNHWIGLFFADLLEFFIVSLISNTLVPVLPMVIFYLGQCIFATLYSICCSLLYHRLYSADRMLMVYGRNGSSALEKKFSSRPEKYNIVKSLSEDLGVEEIVRELSKDYDALVINDVSPRIHNTLLKYCYIEEIPVFVTPKLSDILIKGSFDVTIFDTPLYVINGAGPGPIEIFIKRAFDIFFAFLSLVLFSPLFLGIALSIKLEDGGKVFFRQERVGKKERIFKILKFRSMIEGAEKNGEVIPATDRDPRITKVGRWLRSSRMDELPQLVNILKGEMSFVGPRPERTEHVEKYEKEIPEFKLRHKVALGLTGFAQIYGKYNTNPYDKLRLDLMYIQRYSLFLDFKIILLTLRVLFKKDSTEGFKTSKTD